MWSRTEKLVRKQDLAWGSARSRLATLSPNWRIRFPVIDAMGGHHLVLSHRRAVDHEPEREQDALPWGRRTWIVPGGGAACRPDECGICRELHCQRSSRTGCWRAAASVS